MTHKHEQQKKYGVLFPNAFIFCSALDPYKPIYPTEPTRWQSKFVKRNNLPQCQSAFQLETDAVPAVNDDTVYKGNKQFLVVSVQHFRRFYKMQQLFCFSQHQTVEIEDIIYKVLTKVFPEDPTWDIETYNEYCTLIEETLIW